jgi:Kazal-type serine protease inhibitor domain
MKKLKILSLVLPLSILSCENKDCKELDFAPQYPCTAQFDPVCGCNNKTYPNSCEAERVGIKTYTKGECKK